MPRWGELAGGRGQKKSTIKTVQRNYGKDSTQLKYLQANKELATMRNPAQQITGTRW
jgi:hypothetical protein